MDQDTLSRLIEEAREEEERLAFDVADTSQRKQQELAKLTETEKLFHEADQVVNDLEHTKDRYLKVLDTVAERERSILQLESHVNKLYKDSEQEFKRFDKKREIKDRVKACDQEVRQVLEDLESKERYLSIISDKEQQLVSELEAKYAGEMEFERKRVIEDEEDDDKLNQVMRDMAAFQLLKEDAEREERDETLRNQEVLEQVQVR